ncbi:nucleolar protein dao-5 [Rhipicephalus sanguineus]|uniref:nucleolar protein dao-5 n=1 Tax=Rhipicephalus sanguineus TaxID=34632 RepID=UPI0020C3C19D|nr:nucleolar protein dao-5 [Rhipicephalus sanguineus]
MCAEQALASWGDLQPLRSKMSQKTRSTAPRASGAQAKVPEARRKSMVENSAGSKVRSVSKDNRASNRRESVNPPVQNASKRSSSQHESRKVPAPQETNKKPPGHRDARSTSRQPEVRKSNLQPDGKAVPSRHDGKATAANPKTSSRPAAGVSKNKDALTSRLSNAGAKSPSRGSKVTAESSGQRHSRSNEKERELEKVAATSSSSGVSEKRPKTTHRAKTKATDRPPGGSAEAKQGHEAESEGSSPVTSSTKRSSHASKVEKPEERKKEHKSPYDKGATSHKTAKAAPQKYAASEKNKDSQPRPPTASMSKTHQTVTRQDTYSAEQLLQAGSKETPTNAEVAMETEQSADNARPSTSHSVEKIMPDFSKSETSRTRHSSVADDNYDDDFEDYESDFENDDGVDDESSASSAITDSSSSGSAPASGNDEAPSSKDAFRPTSDRLLAQEHSEVTSEVKSNGCGEISVTRSTVAVHSRSRSSRSSPTGNPSPFSKSKRSHLLR